MKAGELLKLISGMSKADGALSCKCGSKNVAITNFDYREDEEVQDIGKFSSGCHFKCGSCGDISLSPEQLMQL